MVEGKGTDSRQKGSKTSKNDTVIAKKMTKEKQEDQQQQILNMLKTPSRTTTAKTMKTTPPLCSLNVLGIDVQVTNNFCYRLMKN